MKKILIHSLLKSYSILVIWIIIFFASVLSFLSWEQYKAQVSRAQQQVMERLVEELTYEQEEIKTELYEFVSDTDKLISLYHYFEMAPNHYQEWLLQQPLIFSKKISFHDNIANIYRKNEFVKGIDIALVSEKLVFVSTFENRSGKRVMATDYVAPANRLAINLYDNRTSTLIGTAYVSIDLDRLTNIIQATTTMPMAVTIQNELNHSFYTFHQTVDTLFDKSHVTDYFTVTVALVKQKVLIEASQIILLIFLGSLVLVWILLTILQKVFLKYKIQVEDLMAAMQKISEQDNQHRISLENKELDIYLIASQVNRMLDSLDNNVKRIYLLELAQKDANMKALQAQINPHFLYNTLEFFRMYAITKQMDELADIIYEFSTLLRGSISQEKITTIKEELSFCEKHSFICQIRYPKSIAYSFQIDKDCEKVMIPRFTLQPLIENYFIHGIDLKRRNNAISVKVTKQNQLLSMVIKDNGKGMSNEVLCRLQAQLKERRTTSLDLPTHSIGILNVHERLLLHFGDNYSISLQSKEGEGVCYTIDLKI